MIRIVSMALYGLLAGIFLLAGSSILLLGTGLLPAAVRDLIVAIGGGSLSPLRDSAAGSRGFRPWLTTLVPSGLNLEQRLTSTTASPLGR